MTESPAAFTERKRLHALYVPMAARVTNLRTILLNPPHDYSYECARFWAEDVRSTVTDLTTLLEMTKTYLTTNLPLEPSDDRKPSPLP